MTLDNVKCMIKKMIDDTAIEFTESLDLYHIDYYGGYIDALEEVLLLLKAVNQKDHD